MKSSKNTGQKNKYKEQSMSVIPVVIMGIFVLLWQAAVDLLIIQPFILPSPIKVFKALYDERSLLLTHTLVTMGEALAGLGIAIVSGIIFGVLMGYYKPVRVALYPVFVITQTIPLIILAPLFAVWLGFGFLPKVIIVVLMCFFPISITFTQDLIKPDEDMDNILKVMGASKWKSFRLSRIPQALSGLFSGFKIAVTYSITGAVISEWIGAKEGLGIYMTRAMTSFKTAVLFADVVIIIVLSLALYKLVEIIEKKVMKKLECV